jgi:hypothetical protein
VSGLWIVLIWIVCVMVGTFVGYWLGSLLWQAGFEVIGSAVALVGAGIGGILAFVGFMQWYGGRS